MNHASFIDAAAPSAGYYAPLSSPSPIPPPWLNQFYPPPQAPQRSAARARSCHGRNEQNGYHTTISPRYTSMGEYATASDLRVSSRKQCFPEWSNQKPQRNRRNSYSYSRTNDQDLEGNRTFHVGGATYVSPAASRNGKPAVCHSTAPSQRPTNVQLSSSHGGKASPPSAKATEADALKHRIPPGYSLKNWDPTEEPIVLLGSVFDSNSLGKWIYDWTVYHHGPATPISEMAGELWLLLIQLGGKIKRSEECVPRIRTQDNREVIEDFIESGERLTDKLRQLLKRCETPMLKDNKRKDAPQLVKGSGVEFVETLFGRERELEKTERFMQSVRLWDLRFDANCEEILKKPTQNA